MASARAWPQCALACEMVKEKNIDWQTAVMRVPAEQLDQVLAPVFDRTALKDAPIIATGLARWPRCRFG